MHIMQPQLSNLSAIGRVTECTQAFNAMPHVCHKAVGQYQACLIYPILGWRRELFDLNYPGVGIVSCLI